MSVKQIFKMASLLPAMSLLAALGACDQNSATASTVPGAFATTGSASSAEQKAKREAAKEAKQEAEQAKQDLKDAVKDAKTAPTTPPQLGANTPQLEVVRNGLTAERFYENFPPGKDPSNPFSLNEVGVATFEAWIRPDSYDKPFGRVFEKGGVATGTGYSMEYNQGGVPGRLLLVGWHMGRPADEGMNSYGQMDNVPINQWSHVVATVSPPTGFGPDSFKRVYRMYYNGHLVSQRDGFKRSYNASQTLDLFIGQSSVNQERPFPGKIDDFRVYTRALSADEIYNNCRATTARHDYTTCSK